MIIPLKENNNRELLTREKKRRGYWEEDVDFTVQLPSGRKKDYVGEPCYADIGPDYHRYQVTCFPRYPAFLKEAQVFRFFQILTEQSIVPEGTLIWKEGEKILCQVPRNEHAHRSYAALCCHRWVDSSPALPLHFLRILKIRPRIHPIQALQYVASLYAPDGGHSFIDPYESEYVSGAKITMTDPFLGVALRRVFSRDKARSEYLSEDLVREWQRIAPKTKDDSSWNFGRDLYQAKYLLRRPQDILHPALTPLFRKDISNVKEAEAAISSIWRKR